MSIHTFVFSTEDLSLIVEALMFSGCTDVCVNWGDSENEELIIQAAQLFKFSRGVKLNLSHIDISTPLSICEEPEKIKLIRKILKANKRRKNKR